MVFFFQFYVGSSLSIHHELPACFLYIQSIDFNGIISDGELNGKIPLTVGSCGNPRFPVDDVNSFQILSGLEIRYFSGQHHHLFRRRLISVPYLVNLILRRRFYDRNKRRGLFFFLHLFSFQDRSKRGR